MSSNITFKVRLNQSKSIIYYIWLDIDVVGVKNKT